MKEDQRQDHHHHHQSHDGEDHSHHQGHAGEDHSHHHADFKGLFLKSLPLAIPILLLSPMMGVSLPFLISFPYDDVVVSLLATALLLYGGRPFYEGAAGEFRQRSPGMMALISLGLSVSYLYSVYAVILRYTSGKMAMDFFFELSSLVLVMLLGHWIEMKAVGQAGDAQQALAELIPKDAQVLLEDGSLEVRPVIQLQAGDRVLVQAAESIPADGRVIGGTSSVNEALLTGESQPVEKKVDDRVIGGSINGEGRLTVEVLETGEASFLSQVQQLLRQAASQKSRSEDLAGKVAGALFYIAVTVALLAFAIWWIRADLSSAVGFAVTTLVIACPHALGLAIPLVVARSTSLGAKRGLLVRNREALELANKADVMVLDKTGTLTSGAFKVLKLGLLDSAFDENKVIALMAGLEEGSSHPIAQSIRSYAADLGIEPARFDATISLPGAGLEGHFQGTTYRILSPKAYGRQLDLELPPGATLSLLIEEDAAVAYLALGDELKPTAAGLIQALKSKGIQAIMATGDNEAAARVVAEALEMEYVAEQSPQDKYGLIQSLKEEGKIVIMVGDGVNDGPSLALADVGLAVGAGTRVAIDSADVVLTQSDPGDIEAFLELSQRTAKKMKENLLWGAGYNFFALPLAAGILSPAGLILSPAVGAILMSASTVIVAANAMTLKLDR